jgi:hypothetical protein
MKIEFQGRGAPHHHSIEFVPNGHDIYKIYKNEGNIDEIEEELEKMHKLSNRFVTRMN